MLLQGRNFTDWSRTELEEILNSADKGTKQKTRESIRLDMEVDEDSWLFRVSVRMGYTDKQTISWVISTELFRTWEVSTLPPSVAALLWKACLWNNTVCGRLLTLSFTICVA